MERDSSLATFMILSVFRNNQLANYFQHLEVVTVALPLWFIPLMGCATSPDSLMGQFLFGTLKVVKLPVGQSLDMVTV